MARDYTIDSVEKLEAALGRLKEAQKKFATYTQEQVDKIFLAAATAANKERIPLAKMAVAETGMGVVEDKVIKNQMCIRDRTFCVSKGSETTLRWESGAG